MICRVVDCILLLKCTSIVRCSKGDSLIRMVSYILQCSISSCRRGHRMMRWHMACRRRHSVRHRSSGSMTRRTRVSTVSVMRWNYWKLIVRIRWFIYNCAFGWNVNYSKNVSPACVQSKLILKIWGKIRLLVIVAVPKSQPLIFAQLAFYLHNLGDTVSITSTIKVCIDIICWHDYWLKIPGVYNATNLEGLENDV